MLGLKEDINSKSHIIIIMCYYNVLNIKIIQHNIFQSNLLKFSSNLLVNY